MPQLCAFGCADSSRVGSGVRMHCFPNPDKNPEKFRAWVHLVGGKLETAADYEYYKKKRVCDIHFKENDKNRNNRLNALAVPTLHLHGAVLHVFPNPKKFPERFKLWIDIIGGKPESLTDYDFFIKKRICDIHFKDEHKNRYKRLSVLAIPCNNLPGKRNKVHRL